MKNMKLKSKIHNNLMLNGKKIKIENILKKSIKIFQKKNKKNHVNVLKKSIIKATPVVKLCEVKNKKRRKKNNKIFPYIINKKVRLSLGIKNIIKKTQKPIHLNFHKEIIDQLKNNNESMNNQIENYKMSIKLKKSSFFRWFF